MEQDSSTPVDNSDRMVTLSEETWLGYRNDVSNALRRMADEIDARHVSRNLRTMVPDHHEASIAVHHTVTWGFANLGMDRLFRQATAIDVARQLAERFDHAAALGSLSVGGNEADTGGAGGQQTGGPSHDQTAASE